MRFNFKLFLMLTLLTTTVSAHADPVTAAIVGKFVLNALISMAISAVMSSVFGKDKQSSSQANAGGVLVNRQGSNDPVPVVYGATRVGGTRAVVETSDGAGDTGGTNHLNMAIVLSEGRMNRCTEVLFNDQVVWKHVTVGGSGTRQDLGGGAWQLNDLEPSKYNTDKTLVLVFHEGRTDQPVDQMLQASLGSDYWSNNHRLQGICYLAVKLQADSEAYQGGVPLITVITAGKYIADVSQLTPGSSSAVQITGADQNPVDVLYDFLTDEVYGKGLDHIQPGVASAGLDIDLDSFKAARILATGKYAINGVLPTEEKLYQNIQEILDSFNAMLIYTNGKYKLQIRNSAETSVFEFSADNIIGPVTISGGEKRFRLNKLNVTWRNPASGYNDDTLVASNSTYLAQDNNTVLEQNTQNRLVTSDALLSDLSNWKLDNSRYQIAVNFTAAHTALILECGDICSLTHEAAGWDHKLFRVMEMNITTENTVEISALEYQPSIEI